MKTICSRVIFLNPAFSFCFDGLATWSLHPLVQLRIILTVFLLHLTSYPLEFSALKEHLLQRLMLHWLYQ